MDRYYVKPIIQINPIDYDEVWGVFDSIPYDETHIHCQDEDANLVVWTYNEGYAHKIAEILNVDEYIHESEFDEK